MKTLESMLSREREMYYSLKDYDLKV